MIRKRGSDLAAMAPHADPRWVEEFVVEQRLLGVPGERVGDALATVEAHLVDTGESASQAFGPAAAYARELAAQEGSGERGISPAVTVSAVAGLVGLILLPRAVAAWLPGSGVPVSAGDLVGLALIAVLTAVVLAAADTVLRVIIERPVLGFLAGPVLVVVLVVVFLTWRAPIAVLPVLPVVLVGVVALVVSTVVSARASARERPDLVVDPTGRSAGSERVARLTSVWLMPGLTVLMCALAAVTWALA